MVRLIDNVYALFNYILILYKQWYEYLKKVSKFKSHFTQNLMQRHLHEFYLGKCRIQNHPKTIENLFCNS
jgi:hypothetical protein